jgi:hypothetical protein
MAIILKKRGPVGLDLAPGVKLHVRPAGAADADLARAAALRNIEAIRAGGAALSDYGIDTPDAAPGGFEEVSAALRVGSALFAVELGFRQIVSWEGVLDEDGNPVEPSHRAIALLFNEWAPPPLKGPRRSYGELFLAAMEALNTLERDAGNASASEPGITGAAEATTAASAGRPATAAPAASE